MAVTAGLDILRDSAQDSPPRETGSDLDTVVLAERYDILSSPQYEVGKRLLNKLDLSEGERVLDIGAATGLLTSDAADLVGQTGHVVGVDVLEDRINIARKRARQNLTFEVADAHDLSRFHPNKFDAAYSNIVWHWLTDQAKAFRQTHDALKPKGRFAASITSAEHPFLYGQFREEVLSQELYRNYSEAAKSIPKHYTRCDLEKDLSGAGFYLKEPVEAIPCVIVEETAENMMRFWEASANRNEFDHLPEKLRLSARERMKEKIEGIRTNGKIQMEIMMWIIVANRD